MKKKTVIIVSFLSAIALGKVLLSAKENRNNREQELQQVRDSLKQTENSKETADNLFYRKWKKN